MLKRKGLKFKDYINNIITCEAPPDETAISMFAAMSQKDVAVMCGDAHWNTHCRQDFTKCPIKLIYIGHMKVLATYEGWMSTKDEEYMISMMNMIKKVNKASAKATCKSAKKEDHF